MGETYKMALGMQMELPSLADSKHQAETSKPSWALSQAKLNPDSPANAQLSPELNPEPSSDLSQVEH